jgi:hypothetical protein
MKSINILLGISILLLSVISSSCDDDIDPSIDSESVDCQYCFEEMPEYVDMELIFNVEASDKRVYFTIYAGFAFASEVYMTGESYENSFWVSVIPDQKYTVVASYVLGNQTVYVVNDCYVKTELFNYACDDPCYYVYEASCDLKFKQ